MTLNLVGCGKSFMQLAGTRAGARRVGRAAVSDPAKLRPRGSRRPAGAETPATSWSWLPAAGRVGAGLDPGHELHRDRPAVDRMRGWHSRRAAWGARRHMGPPSHRHDGHRPHRRWRVGRRPSFRVPSRNARRHARRAHDPRGPSRCGSGPRRVVARQCKLRLRATLRRPEGTRLVPSLGRCGHPDLAVLRREWSRSWGGGGDPRARCGAYRRLSLDLGVAVKLHRENDEARASHRPLVRDHNLGANA